MDNDTFALRTQKLQMRVYKDLTTLPDFNNTIITIGSFDGVHTGHQHIITRLKELSDENKSETVVLTFHPHPRSVVYPKDKTLRLLSSIEEKIELFETYGIDHLVIVPFTIEFSQISPLEYIQDFLVKQFSPSCIVIGYDHRFGLNRAGNIDLLRMHKPDYGYNVIEIPKQDIEEITISSTKIRTALSEGNLEMANLLLNHSYRLSGTVVKGKQLGTELGYPTANLSVEEPLKLIPKDGIYACKIDIGQQCYEGMLYIGEIPTIETAKKTIEVNIFDFDEDIYGQRISIQVLKFLREDEKFDNLESLKVQLAKDKIDSQAYFAGVEPTQKLDATIAILNYNSRDFLEMYLPSVLYSSRDEFDILVIDNASKDDSVEFVNEHFPEVRVVQLEDNLGFAEGYNQGLKGVKSKYTVLLNSDVEVAEDWLNPLIEYLEANPKYAAVMPKIKSLEDRTAFEYAGAAGGYLDKWGYPYCRGRVFDTVEKDEGQYDDVKDVFWTTGAAMVIRTELFKSLGGFDGDYFAHQEEIDLCWRMHRAGYKLAVVPSSVIFHLGGGTLDYGSSRKIFLNFRNSLSTLFKNEVGLQSIFKVFIRLILDGIAGVKFLFSGELGSTWAILKAHFAFYAMVPSLLRKKKDLAKRIDELSIGPSDMSGKSDFSIVSAYFLRGKKVFTDLEH